MREESARAERKGLGTALEINKIWQTTNEALKPKGCERFKRTQSESGFWDLGFSVLTCFFSLTFAFCILPFAF
ncbi:MAG TPA: hypothetical protein VEO19_09385 [Terriglobia bacterium]|nr:hypothetical protein [Terriglobia bacterium]